MVVVVRSRISIRNLVALNDWMWYPNISKPTHKSPLVGNLPRYFYLIRKDYDTVLLYTNSQVLESIGQKAWTRLKGREITLLNT